MCRLKSSPLGNGESPINEVFGASYHHQVHFLNVIFHVFIQDMEINFGCFNREGEVILHLPANSLFQLGLGE